MMGTRDFRFIFRILTCILLGFFLSGAPPALAQTQAPPAEESFVQEFGKARFGGSIGWAYYDYEESLGTIDSSYDSDGISWNLFANFMVFDRFRVGFDWEAARIDSARETWTNLPIGVLIGVQVNQTNNMEVDLDMFDLDASFSVLRSENVEFELVAGWHFLRHDFTRSSFAFQVLGFTLASTLGPVSEEVDANGPKVGVRLAGKISPQLYIDSAFNWNFLTDLTADNSLLGTIDSEGNSIRWRVALNYRVRENFDIGLSYRGLFIDVNEGQSANAILPSNKTSMNSLFAIATFRF